MPNPNHLRTQSHKRRSKTVSCGQSVKAEYDFSQAERGKFYHKNAVFSFPVYLDPDVLAFLNKLAERKKVDVQDLVNDWLRANMKLVQSAQ
jgi:hypothetical protein